MTSAVGGSTAGRRVRLLNPLPRPAAESVADGTRLASELHLVDLDGERTPRSPKGDWVGSTQNEVRADAGPHSP